MLHVDLQFFGGRGSGGGNNVGAGNSKNTSTPEIRTVRGVERMTFEGIGVVKLRPQYAKSDKYKQNPNGWRVETSLGKSVETFRTKEFAIAYAVERWGKSKK